MLVIIDRVLKVYMTNLLSGRSRVDFIPHFMHLIYVENTGASFGMFKKHTVILSIITSIVIIGMMYFIVSKKSSSKLLNAAVVLITAGGMGNLYDRIANGYVVDYLEFSFVNYAVFNFADVLVNIGAVLLFVYLVFFERKKNMVLGNPVEESEETKIDAE